jgi:NAD(P)-dependent dehydrogenase (short-subunit alcohol dehydrogenase family)
MRVLLSAIGWHPEHGSEGGIGWNAVRALSKEHKLHVLTSVSQRAALETAIRAAIARKPKGHDFDYTRQTVAGQVTRHMSHTGG